MEHQILDWFETFQRIVDEYGILSENIYNMDETGNIILAYDRTNIRLQY